MKVPTFLMNIDLATNAIVKELKNAIISAIMKPAVSLVVLLSIVSTTCNGQFAGRFDYINNNNRAVRLSIPLTSGRALDSNVTWFSTLQLASLTEESSDKRIHVSSNLLPALPGIAAFLLDGGHESNSPIPMLLLLPILLPNIGFQVPIVRQYAFSGLSMSTDYYLLSPHWCVYSELSLSLTFRYQSIALESNYSLPVLRGYFQDRTPYLGVRLWFIP
jgi:hypothetical protein